MNSRDERQALTGAAHPPRPPARSTRRRFPVHGPARALTGRENLAWRQVRLHDPSCDIKTTDSVIPGRGLPAGMKTSMMTPNLTKQLNFEQGNPGEVPQAAERLSGGWRISPGADPSPSAGDAPRRSTPGRGGERGRSCN